MHMIMHANGDSSQNPEHSSDSNGYQWPIEGSSQVQNQAEQRARWEYLVQLSAIQQKPTTTIEEYEKVEKRETFYPSKRIFLTVL